MARNKLSFPPLTSEQLDDVMTYYKQHSIFHNPEQWAKDMDKMINELEKMIEDENIKTE